MPLTTTLWFVLFCGLIVLSFLRPTFGVAVYMMTFFANPPYWWWGRNTAMAGTRWNLIGGCVLIAAALFAYARAKHAEDPGSRRTRTILLFLVLNATFVHVMLASDQTISVEPYILSLKFALLYFLIIVAIRTPLDLHIVAMILTIGIGYWGIEATIFERGSLSADRLESFGGPGAQTANSLASCVASLLPLGGAILLARPLWEKLIVLFLLPLAVNVVVLCNSRGAFLSLIVAAAVFLATARGKLRIRAACGLVLGGVGALLLMGNPQILERFLTTFDGEEKRDASARSRLDYWKAGIMVIVAHPLGTGGDGFKKVHAAGVLPQVGHLEIVRSVHNGFLNDACEWGIQGLTLHLLFLASAAWCAYKTMEYRRRMKDETTAFFGASLLACMATFLGTCMFGDFLDNEWGYWFAALAVAYARVYGPQQEPKITRRSRSEESDDDPDFNADRHGELAGRDA